MIAAENEFDLGTPVVQRASVVQRARIADLARQLGWGQDVADDIRARYGVGSIAELTTQQASQVLAVMEHAVRGVSA